MNQFGSELRRLRRRAGLSQERLAAQAGLSPEAVSLLERGRRTPRLTTMRLLADAMQLPTADRAALFSAAEPTEPTAPHRPSYLDPLVGRQAELDALRAIISRPESRLVTITGPSGVGKTRLAAEYASRHASEFPDGLHWLPLGPIADAAAVLPALTGALGVRGTAQPSVRDVTDQLRTRSGILLIDNAEHHLEACAAICRAVLPQAASMRILITSRHLLQIPGEVVFTLTPLPVTDGGGVSPAAQLFLTRAGLDPAADLERPDIERICRRLDGLPLALELAAARTKVLSVRELADSLDNQLSILRARGPDGDQQLVDAMVSWSYHALTSREQQLFERLSVFGATFGREAVAALCGGAQTEIEVLDGLAGLVAKSLVARDDDGGPRARFRLLYLIRQYAADRLAERADADTIRRRHAEFYCSLIEDAAPRLVGGDQHEALATIDRELSNLRRAISWSIERRSDLALRLVGSLDRWCYLRGRYSDGRAWATAALAAADGGAPGELIAPAVRLAANLAFLQCDYDGAARLTERAHALAEDRADAAGIAWSVSRLGAIARERGSYTEAERLHQQALDLARELGDPHEEATQLNYLSFVSWISGRYADAEPLGHQALRRMRGLGDDEGVIWALINLGAAARYRGELAAAAVVLRQCLDLGEELAFREGIGWACEQLAGVTRLSGDPHRALGLVRAGLAEHEAVGDRWRAASAYDELAATEVALDDPVAASRHLAAADRLRADIGVPVPAAERAGREQTVAATRAALGPAALIF